MKKKCLIFFLTFVSCILANAQEYYKADSLKQSETIILSDSLVEQDFKRMSLSYYESKTTFDRNFNFELYNKQRRLRMWSNEVMILGYASFLGVCFGGPCLFPDASSWILIPSEVVIAGGLVCGSIFWSSSLRRKADAIRESSISLLDINKKSDVYGTRYYTE